MATPAQRTHMAAIMRLLLANEGKIHYSQVRPMSTRAIYEQQLVDMFARGNSITTDCSETTTLVCRLAGLKSPNGSRFPYQSGQGFTGTMLEALKHYSDPRLAGIGALVVFSDPHHLQGNHVAQVLTPGVDPWLFSHGSESGPKRRRLSTETDIQNRIHPNTRVTFLSIAEL